MKCLQSNLLLLELNKVNQMSTKKMNAALCTQIIYMVYFFKKKKKKKTKKVKELTSL
jgi:hypothetical protein